MGKEYEPCLKFRARTMCCFLRQGTLNRSCWWLRHHNSLIRVGREVLFSGSWVLAGSEFSLILKVLFLEALICMLVGNSHPGITSHYLFISHSWGLSHWVITFCGGVGLCKESWIFDRILDRKKTYCISSSFAFSVYFQICCFGR